MLSDVRVERFEPDIFFSNGYDGMIYALSDGKLSERETILQTEYVAVFEWYYAKLVCETNETRMRAEEMRRIKQD